MMTTGAAWLVILLSLVFLVVLASLGVILESCGCHSTSVLEVCCSCTVRRFCHCSKLKQYIEDSPRAVTQITLKGLG